MSCYPVPRRRSLLLPLALGAILTLPALASAYGPRGFNTVVIDAGHGGLDRGGGPGQRIPEKPYTLDSAIRLERALRRRGFRTVMTRRSDVFIPLRERTGAANRFRYGSAIFVSVHYNSGERLGARGFETYFYRSDSFGLAARLHRAQLASMNTEDRRVRRRGFYVIRNTAIPSVLLEGGFLTNPDEARIITNSSYRQRWADNVANAIAAQAREGDPGYNFGSQPPITTERLASSRSSYSHTSYSRSSYSHRSSSRRSHRSSSARSSRGRSRGHSSVSRSSRGRSKHVTTSKRQTKRQTKRRHR